MLFIFILVILLFTAFLLLFCCYLLLPLNALLQTLLLLHQINFIHRLTMFMYMRENGIFSAKEMCRLAGKENSVLVVDPKCLECWNQLADSDIFYFALYM